MKLKYILIGLVALFIVLNLFFFFGNKETKKSDIRLGYMTLWAEGAFPAEAMREAGIADKYNLNVSYVKTQYGPPLVEAALAGQIDVLLVGWVPAVNLMSKSDDWVVVGKMTYFPMALMARNGSGIQKVEDLKGKKVGVGVGTGPYPLVIDSLQKKGLVIGKDVQIVNMKPADMAVALKTKQVDAIAWAEPSTTLFEQQGLAYVIEEYNDIGFIVVSKKYLNEHPDEIRRFLKTYKESQFYIAQNKKQVYQWFSEESQFDIKLVEALRYSEPNFNAEKLEDININIEPKWIKLVQEKIDFEYKEKIIDKPINISEKIDLRYIS